MAWSSAELSSDEIAWASSDKPCVLGGNALTSPTKLEWRSARGSGPLADASYPSTCAWDGYADLVTRPSSAGTTRYFSAEFASPGITFDSLVILGHNFASKNATALVLYLADDAAHTTGVATISLSSLLPTGDTRIVALDLHHTGAVARRYSSVRYLSIGVTCATSQVVEIGELILGRRRQLKARPSLPWDPWHTRTDKVVVSSLSGVKTTYVRNKGQRVLTATLRPYEDDRVSDLQALWADDCDHGTLPFFWIDEPETAPEQGVWMIWDQNDAEMPYQSIYERAFTIQATEQGPDYLALE